MASVNSVKISVLQWNEKLQNVEKSHGLFLFRIKKQTHCESTETHDHKSRDCSVHVFDRVKLSTADSTEWVVYKAMEGLKIDSPERIINRVRREISAYLFRYFRLNRDIIHETKPRIVIVVDVHVSEAKRPRANRCVSGELKDEEVKKIRGVLMFLLKEPIVLWVRPLVSCEPRGIYQLQQQLQS